MSFARMVSYFLLNIVLYYLFVLSFIYMHFSSRRVPPLIDHCELGGGWEDI